MAGQYIFSNILHSIEESIFHTGMNDEERNEIIDRKLKDLNKSFDLQVIINET